MLTSAENANNGSSEGLNDGKSLAVIAESLFLLNLLLLPGLAFVVLIGVYIRSKVNPEIRQHTLAVNHVQQTFGTSLLGGMLIVGVIGALIAAGGLDSGAGWMIILLYFTLVHSVLILFGVLGLVKAMNGELFRYPLIGAWVERLPF